MSNPTDKNEVTRPLDDGQLTTPQLGQVTVTNGASMAIQQGQGHATQLIQGTTKVQKIKNTVVGTNPIIRHLHQPEMDEAPADAVSNVNKLTYSKLLSIAINNKGWLPNSRPAKNLLSQIRKWCQYHGLTLESKAAATLADSNFEQYLAEIPKEAVDIKSKSDAKYKLQSAVREIKHIFDHAVTNESLPLNFTEAYREALVRQGLTSHRLGLRMEIEFGYSKWIRSTLMRYEGKIHPLHKKKASRVITDIEKALRLEPGILLNRAFHPTKLILMGSVAPLKFREHLCAQLKSRYRLKALPPLVQEIWPLIVHWRTQEHLIVDGKFYINKLGTYWASPATIKKTEFTLLFYFGFLHLKNNVKPGTFMTREEMAENGKGINIEDLSIRHLFDIRLLIDYFNFLKARNVKNKFTIYNITFLGILCSWVNKPFSFFNAHPILSEFFGVTNANGNEWPVFLADLHKNLLSMKREFTKAVDGPSRDPYEALKVVFDDTDPYALFLEMAKKMEADLPPRSQKTRRAVAYRNLVVVSILMEVPMRAKNTVQLELGKSLFFDRKTKLWTVYIEKNQLKNHHSPHAKDINRTFSPETSLLMSKYWGFERKNLRDPEISDVFLLPCIRNKEKRKTNLDWPGIGTSNLYVLLHNTFTRYFGIGNGSGVFRHILATSILKSDSSQFAVAAAVLNNSESMIRKAYNHLKQVDDLRTAEAWRIEQIKKFDDLNK